MVVKDRQQAWHVARGGVPVVIVDFSTGSDTCTDKAPSGSSCPSRNGNGSPLRDRVGWPLPPPSKTGGWPPV